MGYKWDDFWHTSPVEGARNAYKDALREIEDCIRIVHERMSWVPSSGDGLMKSLGGSSVYDTSEGDYVHEFNGKIAFVNAELGALYHGGALGSAEPALWAKQREIERRLAILEAACKREDRDEKLISLSDIKF